MTTILSALTLLCVVMVILDRVPERYLTSDLMLVRVSVRPDRLWVLVMCEAFLFEWCVNEHAVERPGVENGMRLLAGCENWWTREIRGTVSYRRVIVDSREFTPDSFQNS